MDLKIEGRLFAAIVVVFLAAIAMPIGDVRFEGAVLEGLALLNWYAREHVILCLVPAFLIAGAVAVYIRQDSVLRHLGPDAPPLISYGLASVSGAILAVCSCTVLPLFGGIYRRGAGLGPAVAFLYAGPAINIMAVTLTAKVLGLELGIARAVAAIGFAAIIGALMHLIYRREEKERASSAKGFLLLDDDGSRSPGGRTFVLAAMIAILVFANWTEMGDGFWQAVAEWKWPITAALSLVLGWFLVRRWQWPSPWLFIAVAATFGVALAFPKIQSLAFAVGAAAFVAGAALRDGEDRRMAEESWWFAKRILPLLFGGVLVAGFLLGTPGGEGLIPSQWVAAVVGGESISANLAASILGGLMYFATLTEIPIVQGLIGAGMGKGPALALLLAGPAVSLPNMLVIRGVLGTEKTLVYVGLVVGMASLCGIVYGNFLI